MHPVFQFLLATFLFMLIHVSVMALCARAFGITIRRIAYGVGPTLFSIGKAQLKLLPFAGSVVLKDTREEDIYDDDRGNDIYNERPLWQQLAVLLSGVAVPLILALGLLGAQGWHSFTGAFAQIIAGALAPLSTAQQLLADGDAFARSHGFALVAALVSVKLCALQPAAVWRAERRPGAAGHRAWRQAVCGVGRDGGEMAAAAGAGGVAGLAGGVRFLLLESGRA